MAEKQSQAVRRMLFDIVGDCIRHGLFPSHYMRDYEERFPEGDQQSTVDPVELYRQMNTKIDWLARKLVAHGKIEGVDLRVMANQFPDLTKKDKS